MSKLLSAIFVLTMMLGLGALPLMADHGDKGNKHGHGDKHADYAEKGWQHGNGYEYRTYAEGVPPGWSHGKKTGWGNCGMPPGQAKKYGCRTYVYQGRPYYYYQQDDGRIFVRRPTIEFHAGVDIVQ